VDEQKGRVPCFIGGSSLARPDKSFEPRGKVVNFWRLKMTKNSEEGMKMGDDPLLLIKVT